MAYIVNEAADTLVVTIAHPCPVVSTTLECLYVLQRGAAGLGRRSIMAPAHHHRSHAHTTHTGSIPKPCEHILQYKRIVLQHSSPLAVDSTDVLAMSYLQLRP